MVVSPHLPLYRSRPPTQRPLEVVYLDASLASLFLLSYVLQSGRNPTGAMEPQEFDGGDEPFLEWMKKHPEGYVLNVKQKSTSGFAVFHDSQCSHISGVLSSHRSDAHTKHDKIKVCAEETEPLVEWLADNRPKAVFGAEVCGHCELEIEELGFHRRPEETGEPESYEEGSTVTVKINRYERSKAGRKACLEHYGAECQVCGLRFEERYGEIGEGFIEVHHEVPLSETEGDVEVDPIEDLKPVCPNCHAMLHQESPPLRIEELRTLLLG